MLIYLVHSYAHIFYFFYLVTASAPIILSKNVPGETLNKINPRWSERKKLSKKNHFNLPKYTTKIPPFLTAYWYVPTVTPAPIKTNTIPMMINNIPRPRAKSGPTEDLEINQLMSKILCVIKFSEIINVIPRLIYSTTDCKTKSFCSIQICLNSRSKLNIFCGLKAKIDLSHHVLTKMIL